VTHQHLTVTDIIHIIRYGPSDYVDSGIVNTIEEAMAEYRPIVTKDHLTLAELHDIIEKRRTGSLRSRTIKLVEEIINNRFVALGDVERIAASKGPDNLSAKPRNWNHVKELFESFGAAKVATYLSERSLPRDPFSFLGADDEDENDVGRLHREALRAASRADNKPALTMQEIIDTTPILQTEEDEARLAKIPKHIAPPKRNPVPLAFSAHNTISIKPRPEPQQALHTSATTTIVHPPADITETPPHLLGAQPKERILSVSEIIAQNLLFLLTFFMLVMAVIMTILFAKLMERRAVWMAANELTRMSVVTLRNKRMQGWTGGWLDVDTLEKLRFMVEKSIGFDRTMLG